MGLFAQGFKDDKLWIPSEINLGRYKRDRQSKAGQQIVDCRNLNFNPATCFSSTGWIGGGSG